MTVKQLVGELNRLSRLDMSNEVYVYGLDLLHHPVSEVLEGASGTLYLYPKEEHDTVPE